MFAITLSVSTQFLIFLNSSCIGKFAVNIYEILVQLKKQQLMLPCLTARGDFFAALAHLFASFFIHGFVAAERPCGA